MRRAVVENPEHAAGLVIRRLGHDLRNQAVEWLDAGLFLAAAEEFCAMDVQGGQVRPGTTTLVFVFDQHRSCGLRGQSAVAAMSSLDAGLFVGRDHELAIAQRLVFPAFGVEIQNAGRFGKKLWVAREDPAAVLPRPDGVFIEPAPNSAVADAGHQTGGPCLASNVRRAEAGKRQPML